METNKVHREVGLQKSLKVVISLLSAKFSGKADITRALGVINQVAGADTKVGFMRQITGTGTVLGNVMIIDLDVPLMRGYPRNKSDESAFNLSVAKALIKEFGRLNVGYVSSEPVKTRTVTIRVETEKTSAELLNALREVTETAEVV